MDSTRGEWAAKRDEQVNEEVKEEQVYNMTMFVPR
jgi:hypothetical protein